MYLPMNVVNGTLIPIYAKINTNTANFLDYLRNYLGYNTVTGTGYALWVNPDRMTMKIEGRHENLYMVTDAYLPKDDYDEATIVVPYYIAKQFGTIEINFLTAHINATTSYYNSASIMPNVVEWEFESSAGWEDSLDGDHTTQTGLPVQTTFSHSGNITQKVGRQIRFFATLRYEYYLQTTTSVLTLHMSMPEIYNSTSVTVHPLTSE